MSEFVNTLSKFSYPLPEHLIAIRPHYPREAAKLLVINQSSLEDCQVKDFPNLLKEGDVLVFNNTKVIPARLYAKLNQREFEIILIKEIENKSWQCLIRNSKKLKPGDALKTAGKLELTILDKDISGEIIVEANLAKNELLKLLDEIGQMPVPPYIQKKRQATENFNDWQDYQTIFARAEGSVAAPTAGLHFTTNLLEQISSKKAEILELTLHVGIGTFKPLTEQQLATKTLHSEFISITAEVAEKINNAKKQGRRIIAVGTTSLRALESACNSKGQLEGFSGETNLFITPGYQFQVADLLFTNFHLPESSLLMLVAAFAGYDNIMSAYQHALRQEYRFYSYGDATLVYKEKENV